MNTSRTPDWMGRLSIVLLFVAFGLFVASGICGLIELIKVIRSL